MTLCQTACISMLATPQLMERTEIARFLYKLNASIWSFMSDKVNTHLPDSWGCTSSAAGIVYNSCLITGFCGLGSKHILRVPFFSCDQAALWMVFSVRLSVCPSVCPSVRLSVCPSVCLSVCPSVTPFWLCSHHRIIMKFSGVITLDQGKVHAKGQGQRSKVKVTEVTTQIFVSGL